MSELAAEYLRIGYEVKIIQHEVEPNSCGVCFDTPVIKDDNVYCDIFVRSKQTKIIEK